MTHLLHTERLHLRPCQSDDLDSLHELWTEADVRRFLFDDRQISRSEARSFVAASATNFTERGFAPFIAGATESHIWHPPPALGRGYAKEAASAVLRYAFDVLGIESVVADVDEPNLASIRVLEALGMSRTRRAIVNGRPLLYYEIHSSSPSL